MNTGETCGLYRHVIHAHIHAYEMIYLARITDLVRDLSLLKKKSSIIKQKQKVDTR